MLKSELTTLHFSSSDFSGQDRVEAFREIYGRLLMQLEIDPLAGHDFDLDFTVRGFPGFGVAYGRLSPTRNTHTSAMISDDGLVLVFTPQGSGTLSQIGREVTIHDGEATLVTNDAPGIFLGNIPSKLCNFRFDRTVLESLGVDVGAALVRPIPRENPALRLMVAYAGIMQDENALATPDLCKAVADHMHDLAALILGATADGREVASRRGVRAARLRSVKQDIQANLASRTLSADAVAVRQGISARYINMLFEAEGVSFSEFVLARRLAIAHRMLGEVRRSGQTVSEIAFACGFGDLSYFNRTFRRRFGMTPSDVRAAWRNGG